MTESAEHVINAAIVLRRHLGNLKIPVIPLFGNKIAPDNLLKSLKAFGESNDGFSLP
ncbi:MAG: hypothetical protein R2827_04115 [Bdellovibrionales bacterium]